MSQHRVGTCSICGGDVVGYRGAWLSINPPPPDKCSDCGAVSQTDVIKMHPAPPQRRKRGPNSFRNTDGGRARPDLADAMDRVYGIDANAE